MYWYKMLLSSYVYIEYTLFRSKIVIGECFSKFIKFFILLFFTLVLLLILISILMYGRDVEAFSLGKGWLRVYTYNKINNGLFLDFGYGLIGTNFIATFMLLYNIKKSQIIKHLL